MFSPTFPRPGGDALGKSRSGRDFAAYGATNYLGASSESGKDEVLGVEAGGFEGFEVVSPLNAQN